MARAYEIQWLDKSTGMWNYVTRISADSKEQAMRFFKSKAFAKTYKNVQTRAALPLGAQLKNPSTIRVRPNPDGTVKVQMKKVGSEYNVYLGGTNVGHFVTREEAVKYGKHLLKSRRLFVKGRVRNGNSEVRELELFIDNDSTLYRQQYQPIQKNLITKMARGIYDHAKAVKLFGYLVESGAKKYAKESGGTWNTMFTVADRKQVAENLTRHFETEAKLGNYNEMLPKKYKV